MERRWQQVVNKVPPLNLDLSLAMEYSSELRARTTSVTHSPTSASTTSGHRAPVLRPRRSMVSTQSRGYDWSHFNFRLHYLMFRSPVPILGPLTLSLLSHESTNTCNNMRRIGSKRRLRARRDQTHLPVCVVDPRVFPPFLPCTPTSTGVQFGILLGAQILHDAGYDGWIKTE